MLKLPTINHKIKRYVNYFFFRYYYFSEFER